MLQKKGLKINKEKQILLLQEPENEDRYPVVEPGENISLFIDGKKVNGLTVITEDVVVKYELPEQKQEKNINVEVSEDGLKAFLEINIKPAAKYEIELKEVDGINIISGQPREKKYPQITKKELREVLAENKIFFGIKDDILDQLASCQENRRVLIAEGKLPEPGKPGKLIEKTTDKKSEDSKRKKNYYHNNIFSVLPGEVIAKKIAPIPGKKGKTVQGQKISPPSVEDIKLKLGDNVLAGGRGKKIISKIAGRPEIIKSNKQISIDVVPQHVVDGNVGRKTGILEFTGDLIVNGGIDDFFGVDIGGSLLVKRGINEAEIKCKNDVLVGKNIIGSKITVQNNQNQGSLIGSYIQNSELKIPGDVLLMGQGGYTSQIKAGGNIVCAQKRGFLKSGRYHAEGWLATGQLGAPMSKTEIFVGQGLLVYEIKGAVNVRSPRDRRRLEENQKRIFLKVNKEGKLELKAWPDWQKMLLKMQNDKLIEHWRQFKY